MHVRIGLMIRAVAAAIAACCGLVVNTLRADVIAYEVGLDTSPLIGHAAGPFSIALQLTDGSFLGDGNNTVSISGFDFGGGSATGNPTVFGGVSGSLSSTVTLTDSLFLNFLIQGFDPGNHLDFQVKTTNSVDSGGVPDVFSFSILDNTGQELPTDSGVPFFNPFVVMTLDSSTPTIQSFQSDPSRAPAGGGPGLTIPSPQLTGVPEPNLLLLVSAFLTFLASARLVLNLQTRLDR